MIVGSNEELGNELISTTDGTQNTPLHIACKKGNLGAVKVITVLIEKIYLFNLLLDTFEIFKG